ncbi:hypothetical protein, partial [Escherichia coli]|uniref:hypothetical protein n=1 Tax=Escherichia coli TaxID=562 RepID=UPI003D319855
TTRQPTSSDRRAPLPRAKAKSTGVAPAGSSTMRLQHRSVAATPVLKPASAAAAYPAASCLAERLLHRDHLELIVVFAT